MKQHIVKDPKISLCRYCGGTGWFSRHGKAEKCQQCNGTGRVIVSCVMDIDVMPYNPKK